MSGRSIVFGNGRSGKAAAELLRREGREVVVLDGDDSFPQGDFSLAVTSPGITLSHPWQVRARELGIPVVSELQHGAERFRARGGKMLAVTGSKGKSSVVKIVSDGINLAGGKAVPCGNYGKPLCEVVNELKDGENPPWAVVEVSSFQLETTDLPPDAFEAAAILNLQEDHLDRHGSAETYHALKRRLLAMAKQKFDFSAFKGLDGLYVEPYNWDEVADECFRFPGSYFYNDVLAPNGVVAALLMGCAGLSKAAIRRAFREFEPLPHRMQFVAEIDGVRYIDDSKATSIAALVAGVEMAGVGVRLVAGGLPKGDNPKIAISVLSRSVKKVYLIGASADQFFDSWKEAVECEKCGTVQEAVKRVKREAKRGETVLLSPGTASFDQFKSYGERGDVFAASVKKGRER